MGAAIPVVDDGERLTPVALPAEQPVPELVGDRWRSEPALLQPRGDPGLRVLHAEAVECQRLVRGVHRDAVVVERLRPLGGGRVDGDTACGPPRRGRLDHPHDREIEFPSELEVALVVRRDRHDGTRPVSHQHVVRHENRDALVVDGIAGVGTRENAGLLVPFGLPLELGLAGCERAVGADGFGRKHVEAERAPPLRRSPCGPLGRHDLVEDRVLGGEHHVSGAEQRVGARREDVDLHVVVGVDRERDHRPRALPDPVPLHELDRLGPVEQIEVVEQAVGVFGDAQHPLLERPPEDGMVAAIAPPVRGDLFVREHRAEGGAPVDRRFRDVREPMFVDDRGTRLVVEVGPRVAVGIGVGTWRATAGCERGDEVGDGTRPTLVAVVPRPVQLEEDPLRPPVVGDVGRRHAPPIVVAETQRTQLAAHRRDVRLGRGPWMLAGLDRILLGRQPEGVVPHRVEHVPAAHAHEPGVDVGADVAERMPDVQPRTARVREHVVDVELGSLRDLLEALPQ